MVGARARRTVRWFIETDGVAYSRQEVSVGRIAWADVPRVFECDAFGDAGCAQV